MARVEQAMRGMRATQGGPIEVRIEGLPELLRLLDQLPKSMRRTPLTNSLKKAAEPVRAVAVAMAQDGSKIGQKVAESIHISTKLTKSQMRGRRRGGDSVVYVGSSHPLAHWLEWGTAERLRTGKGAKRKGTRGSRTGPTGRMQSHAFMTRAWDHTRDTSLKIFGTAFMEELLKAARRLRNKAQKGKLSIRQQREIAGWRG